MNMEKNPFERHFDSLETLADTISEVLKCPVTIEDASHKLVAYSTHDPQTDPARIATIIGRRVPEKVISALWRDGIIQQLVEKNEPLRISAIHDVGLGDRVAVAIRKQTDILGYIWVLEEHNRLDDHAIGYLNKAADAAKTMLLQLQMQKRKEEQGYSDFFWQLLTGHLKTNEAIRDKADKLGMQFPSVFQVIVMQFDEEISVKLYQQIQYTIKTAQHVRIVLTVTDRNRLILLAAPLAGRGTKDEYREEFAKLVRQMKSRFGAAPALEGGGSPYTDYTMVERSYQEALAVLSIKKSFPEETHSAFDYTELGYYRYMPAIAEEKRHHPYENRSLQKLREYDAEHSGDLLHTLDVFLRCDSNMKAAAEALHVHTNTLNYRLKRIAEIGGIDINDMDQKVTLYLEFKAAQYALATPRL